jgi:8-oxo-dGTP pyrophosphatase MutT (NUDIX family)
MNQPVPSITFVFVFLNCPARILGVRLCIMISELKHLLAERNVVHATNTNRIAAAVLAPIFIKNGEYYLVFTRRTQHVSTHKGQISFPGGVRDKTDPSLQYTALRETCEEIGVDTKDIEVLGELDDFLTHVSYFVISPFIGLIPWPYSFKISERETAEILQVPISGLLDEKTLGHGNEIFDDNLVPSFFFNYEDSIIWGATARILQQFLEIWQLAEDNIKQHRNS